MARQKKVPLEEALRAIAAHVAETTSEARLDADTATLDVQFALEAKGGDLAPVVYVDGEPPAQQVHRLQVEVRLYKRERPGLQDPEFMTTISDHPPPPPDSQIFSLPRPQERPGGPLEGLRALVEGKVTDEHLQMDLGDEDEPAPEPPEEPAEPEPKSKGPRIIVSKNPSLKLRAAKDVEKEKAKKAPPGDEPMAQQADVAFSPPPDTSLSAPSTGVNPAVDPSPKPKSKPPKPKSPKPKRKRPASGPGSRFVVFDHQRAVPRTPDGGASDES